MDRQTFIQLAMEREQTMYRVARSLLRQPVDQQDAVQEALLKAWAKRGTLREEQFFPAWIVRILINECHTIGRKQSRMVLVETMPEEARVQEDQIPWELNAMVDTLPEKLRLPVILHYAEGFPLKEIASMLRCPLGTVKKRLHDARLALLMETQQDEEARSR